MARKKKGKKKGSKKKGGEKKTLVSPYPALIKPILWVVIHFKLKGLANSAHQELKNFFSVKKEFNTATRLLTVKQFLRQKHSLCNEHLEMYKDNWGDIKKILTGDAATLDELGIMGGEKNKDGTWKDGENVVEIHYDFKPSEYDCPLLLVSPRG